MQHNVRTFLPEQSDVVCAEPPESRGVRLKELMLKYAETHMNRTMNGWLLWYNAERTVNTGIANPLSYNNGLSGARDLGLLAQLLPKLEEVSYPIGYYTVDVKQFPQRMLHTQRLSFLKAFRKVRHRESSEASGDIFLQELRICLEI